MNVDGPETAAVSVKNGKSLATFFIAVYAGSTVAKPTFNEIKPGYKPADTLILNRQGEVTRSENRARHDRALMSR